MDQQTIISIETSNGTVNTFRLAGGAAVSWLADEWGLAAWPDVHLVDMGPVLRVA